MNKEKNLPISIPAVKGFTREQKDLDLKKQLIASPELFITEKGSDEYLDKLALRVKLIGGEEFSLSDYVTEVMADYESKFSKDWFYRLADLHKVDRSVMDRYVKPEFVRQFIIRFVYGRFPYKMLKALRSKNRKSSSNNTRTKLFQHLTKTATEQLEIVIEQVFTLMGSCNNALDFKMKYSNQYKIYVQLDLGI